MPYHSICLTGGEPLLQKDFLKKFLKLVKYDGTITYLETNGILFDALSELIENIDIIAMDFKLPSSTGMAEYWLEHRKFLEIALTKDVFVKMVVCSSTQQKDMVQAVSLISKIGARDIPVVLQPNFFELSKGLLAKVRKLQRICSQHLNHVQVIPQLHKVSEDTTYRTKWP